MLKITSDSIPKSGKLPKKYTCHGENISPQISIKNVPEKTVTFLVLIQNLSTPKKEWINWVVWNIPNNQTEIPENVEFKNATVGMNSHLEHNYSGPCPNNQKHEIQISVYALKEEVNIDRNASFNEIMLEISEIVLSQGILGCTAISG